MLEELSPDLEVIEDQPTNHVVRTETSDADSSEPLVENVATSEVGRATRRTPLQIECKRCGRSYEWIYYGNPRKYCYDCRPANQRRGGTSGRDSSHGTAASETEWTDFISEKVLSYGVTLYVTWLTAPFKALTDVECEALLMTPKERTDISRPLGKAIAKTGLNAKYGRAVMDAGDVIDALFSLSDWFSRTRPILKDRKRRKEIVIRDKRTKRKYDSSGSERSNGAVTSSSPTSGESGDGVVYIWGPGEGL